MFGWITRFSLQFRILVLALAAGIIAFGIINVPRIAVDTMPEFAPAQVEIQTEALGLSAVEVEQLITSPMEADLLNGVAWLDEIRSKSVPGLSSIQLVFEPGTDLLRARQLVAERMTQAVALPNVSAPPLIMQPVSSTSRVLMVKMNSKQLSGIEMSVLARWKIKPRLIGIPGVANVSIWGQREQQLQVEVDPHATAGQGNHARTGHQDHRQRGMGFAAEFPRSVHTGHRRFRRVSQPAPRHPARPPNPDSGRPLQGQRGGFDAGDVVGRHSPGQGRPSTPHRRCRRRTGRRADAGH